MFTLSFSLSSQMGKSMKRTLFVIIFTFLLRMNLEACGFCIEEWVLCDKIYIAPSQLYFEEDSIFIQVSNSQFIETRSIYTDTSGIYFKDYKTKKCESGLWLCSVCGHCNPNYKIWCEICWN